MTSTDVARDYFSDLEGCGSGNTPSDAFYTPRPFISRRPSRQSAGRAGSDSPPPLPTSTPHLDPNVALNGRGKGDDGRHSPSDLNSLTPTLHASLVSEILSLRRDLESKVQFIGELEGNLASTQVEKSEVSSQLAKSEKEKRTLKKEIQHIEHGTIAALEELAGDRDKTKALNEDYKIKLEAAQSRVKSFEKDNERLQSMWQEDKQLAQSKEQNLERRLHAAETQLKMALEGLAAQHGIAALSPGLPSDDDEERRTKDSGFGGESEDGSVHSLPHTVSPAKSHRKTFSRGSVRSLRSYRQSMQSLRSQDSHGLGVSLADELNGDDEYASDDEAEVGVYADAGVQYSRPATPEIVLAKSGHVNNVPSLNDSAPASAEPRVEYIDRSQQMTPEPQISFMDQGQQTMPEEKQTTKPSTMVSAAMQTVDTPLSPPDTPKAQPDALFGGMIPAISVRSASSSSTASISTTMEASTQTDTNTSSDMTVPETPPHKGPGRYMGIPEIVIDSPHSAPPSPRDPVLPPRNRSAGSQTDAGLGGMKDASMQTEEVRFNKELLAKLPPHLHPDALLDLPQPSNLAARGGVPEHTPIKGPPSFQDRLVQSRSSGKVSSAASSPLTEEFPSSPPTMPSPVLYHAVSTDSIKAPLFGQPVEKKSYGLSTPMSNRALKNARLMGNRPSPVPEEKESDVKRSPDTIINEFLSKPVSLLSTIDGSAVVHRSEVYKGKQPVDSASSSLSAHGRRAVHAQHIIASRSSRSRTPSNASQVSSAISGASNNTPAMPFAIPDRASSKQLFPCHSKSEGSQSPTPGALGSSSRRRGQRGIHRKDSLRKIRSHNNLGQKSSSRSARGARSPPLEEESEVTEFPPLPKNAVTFVENKTADVQVEENAENESPPSTGHANVGRAPQGTVVDAIAACMVGEWMLKYVRKRKSFGVADSPGEANLRPTTDGSVNVTGTGTRHKRWVWVSPYERAIMWSSKQPQSNNALMGKTGRKLVIQSVLDVRDDTPLPKNHGVKEPFHRSIVIITPARALKFTATSQEKHYTWLMALSFLAHSPLIASNPGTVTSSRVGTADVEAATSDRTFSLRRVPFRDSLRLPSRSRNQPMTGFNNVSHLSVQDEHDAAPPPIAPSHRAQSAQYHRNSNHIVHDFADMDGDDGAEPPTIPRYGSHHKGHGRKRSLTAPKMPTGTLPKVLMHSSVATPRYPSTNSIGFAVSIGEYGGGYGASVGHVGGATAYVPTGLNSNPVATPLETSVKSSRNSAMSASSYYTNPSSDRNPSLPYEPNSVGTMSMEAFITDAGDQPSILPTIVDDDVPLPGEEEDLAHKEEARDNVAEKLGLFEQPISTGRDSLPAVRPRKSSQGARGAGPFASRLGPQGDSRRSGIVYPDDFDAFDPFKNF